MSDKKSMRDTILSKGKEIHQERMYIADDYLLVLYHAQFHKNYLLVCCKNNTYVYQTINMTLVNQIKIKAHCGSFIPFSNYIALVDSHQVTSEKNVLVLWDYINNKICTKMTFSFEIEHLKASHRCIILSSISSLYVIHFPSLKPIFNDFAGNGLDIVFDISKEGLTIVHSNQNKGEAVVRNFTNMQTNRLLNDVKTGSYPNSLSARVRSGSRLTKRHSESVEQLEQVKQVLTVKAHNQNVIILRLSPNGFRFVSGSAVGTVIRLFSCLNGELLSQLHMSDSLSTIIDIHFIEEGNSIVCLNDENKVNLFHTKMSEEEFICEGVRRGCEIYEQQNPKSFLFFLGFLKKQFRYQRPFSHFILSTKTIQQNQNTKKSSVKNIAQTIGISEIKQQQIHLQQRQSAIHVPQRQQIISKTVIDKKDEQIDFEAVISSSPIIAELNHTNSKGQIINGPETPKRQHSRGSLLMKKKASSLKSGMTSKRQIQIVQMKHKEKDLNFKGIVAFDDHINLKVFRSKYFYQLKYDPFNGGEMIESKSFNILHHNNFKQI